MCMEHRETSLFPIDRLMDFQAFTLPHFKCSLSPVLTVFSFGKDQTEWVSVSCVGRVHHSSCLESMRLPCPSWIFGTA